MAKLTLRLDFDTETQTVTMLCDKVTIGLGQMMCHEALSQLEEQRRLAFMAKIQQQAQEAAIRAAIAGNAKTREV